MVITINHGVENLHEAMNISEERLSELKDNYRDIVDNCLNNGVAEIKMLEDENGFQVGISQSQLVQKLADLATSNEELVLNMLYMDQMLPKIESRCKKEAFILKYGAEAAKSSVEDIELD